MKINGGIKIQKFKYIEVDTLLEDNPEKLFRKIMDTLLEWMPNKKSVRYQLKLIGGKSTATSFSDDVSKDMTGCITWHPVLKVIRIWISPILSSFYNQWSVVEFSFKEQPNSFNNCSLMEPMVKIVGWESTNYYKKKKAYFKKPKFKTKVTTGGNYNSNSLSTIG